MDIDPTACPCCGEFFTPDTLECGGEGAGSCFGMLAALSDDPEGEWDALCDDPYPGDGVMEEWRRHYAAFVASLG